MKFLVINYIYTKSLSVDLFFLNIFCLWNRPDVTQFDKGSYLITGVSFQFLNLPNEKNYLEQFLWRNIKVLHKSFLKSSYNQFSFLFRLWRFINFKNKCSREWHSFAAIKRKSEVYRPHYSSHLFARSRWAHCCRWKMLGHWMGHNWSR